MARKRRIDTRRMHNALRYDTQAGAFVPCPPDSEGNPCTCANCAMQTPPEEKKETQVTRKRLPCDGGKHKLVKRGSYAVCAYGCGCYFRLTTR